MSPRALASTGLLLLLGACTPQPGQMEDDGLTGPGSGGTDSGSADDGTTASTDADGTSTDSGDPPCDLPCDPGQTCVLEAGEPTCTCAPDPEACPPGSTCQPDGTCTGLVWPNEESTASSDPWIVEHHDQITQMRPRVLALNFVNHRSMAEMSEQLEQMRDIIAESTRYRGYADAAAPAFLEYELAYSVDLRDAEVPPGWPYNNSTLYPREEPVEGYWGFDYERLFDADYADLYGIEDPADPGTSLRLCDAIELGLVHEVWIYADADVPDASAAEMLELKPYYDEEGNRLPGAMDRCTGNGCFDEEDVIPCARSVRVAFFNNTRGPGCFLESISHAFEGMGRKGSTVLPYLSRYFPEFAGMQLDEDYGLPVANWYACPYGEQCLSYPSETSVSYAVSDVVQGTIEDYDPVCGNVHWPPNARLHYDLSGTDTVLSSCTHWRDGSEQVEPYDGSQHAAYAKLAPDCMGPFLMWWRQNIPGHQNGRLDDDGAPMRNWWPFLFY